MKIDIMTLFPELIDGVMKQSIIGRAQTKGLVSINPANIRDFALDKHHKADDSPYGGGRGMVMLPEPLYLCHEHLCAGEKVYTVMMSAQGSQFTQQKARELLEKKHIIIVCGHYEGIDQRFIDACVDEEISIGDFVLTGGEIPAMAVADADVLLSGHHANIARWRRKMSLIRTKKDRPDLFAKFKPENKQDKKILAEIEQESN